MKCGVRGREDIYNGELAPEELQRECGSRLERTVVHVLRLDGGLEGVVFARARFRLESSLCGHVLRAGCDAGGGSTTGGNEE